MALDDDTSLLNLVLTCMTDVILQIDRNGRIQFASPSLESIYGYRINDTLNIFLSELIHSEDWTHYVRWQESGLQSNAFSLQLRIKHANGDHIWSEVKICMLSETTSTIQTLVLRDIHTLHAAQDNLLQDLAKQKTELAVMQTENDILRWIQKMSDIILFIDRIESVWTQFRDMAIQLLGIQAGIYVIDKEGIWQVEDWFGLNDINIDTLFKSIEHDAVEPISANNDHYRFIQGCERLIKDQPAGQTGKVAEFRYDVYLEHSRHSVMYLYYIQPDAVLRPIVLSLMEFFRLALQVVTQRALLKSQNEQDPLTQIANRRGLESRMESYFLLRNPVQALFLLFDLDGFKNLNDSLGHQQGDATLKLVAKYFSAQIRVGDWLARLGGDEFVLVLRETTWNSDLIQKMQKLIKDSPVFQGSLGLTMGAVSLPEEARNFQEAYRLADERMYLGKRMGKNRIVGPNNQIIEF